MKDFHNWKSVVRTSVDEKLSLKNEAYLWATADGLNEVAICKNGICVSGGFDRILRTESREYLREEA